MTSKTTSLKGLLLHFCSLLSHFYARNVSNPHILTSTRAANSLLSAWNLHIYNLPCLETPAAQINGTRWERLEKQALLPPSPCRRRRPRKKPKVYTSAGPHKAVTSAVHATAQRLHTISPDIQINSLPPNYPGRCWDVHGGDNKVMMALTSDLRLDIVFLSPPSSAPEWKRALTDALIDSFLSNLPQIWETFPPELAASVKPKHAIRGSRRSLFLTWYQRGRFCRRPAKRLLGSRLSVPLNY